MQLSTHWGSAPRFTTALDQPGPVETGNDAAESGLVEIQDRVGGHVGLEGRTPPNRINRVDVGGLCNAGGKVGLSALRFPGFLAPEE